MHEKVGGHRSNRTAMPANLPTTNMTWAPKQLLRLTFSKRLKLPNQQKYLHKCTTKKILF